MLLRALRNRSVPMDTVGEFEIQTRQQVANAHRIVIKLGTNVIMRDDGAAAVGLRSKVSHRQLSMIQTSRKTAMPTRLTSVVTMRATAPAFSNSARQRAAILARPVPFMETPLTKKLDPP